jgi:hypothetical protein
MRLSADIFVDLRKAAAISQPLTNTTITTQNFPPSSIRPRQFIHCHLLRKQTLLLSLLRNVILCLALLRTSQGLRTLGLVMNNTEEPQVGSSYEAADHMLVQEDLTVLGL